MTLDSFLLLFFGGILAGTVGALLGLGGGVFLVPYLVLVARIPMHQAIATSILGVIATSSAGAAMNVERHTVNIRLGMLLETATVTGAIAGGLSASLLSATTLARIFSVLLVVVASLMLFQMRKRSEELQVEADGEESPARKSLSGKHFDETSGQWVSYSVKRLPATMAVSFLAGNISGLLGIGGGIFKVPAMTLLSGVPIKVATATSNFMIGVTASASAFIYFSGGHVNPMVASSAVLGVLVGSFAGIRLSRVLHARSLTWLFIAVLVAVAVQLFLKTQ